jgi:hypothetical protein
MIPAINPVKGEGSIPSTVVEANPMPKHRGRATKNTTRLEDRSCLQFLKSKYIENKSKRLIKRF